MRLGTPALLGGLAALVAIAAGACGGGEGSAPPARASTAPPPPDSYATRVRPGTLAVGARAADPEGGAEWAVRTWRPRPGRRDRFSIGSRFVCLQAGRLAGERLVRTFDGGGERELRVGDRTVCLDAAHLTGDTPPVAIERLADDPASPGRLVRTVVAGIAPDGAESATLEVRGRAQELPIEPSTRSFLAVLDGGVRRADLVLRLRGRQRSATFDFGRGVGESNRIVAGSIRRGPEVADPLGGPPFALLRYSVEPDGSPCAEAGRVVAGEVGPYDATWGSFLDAPTPALAPQFEDGWAPTGPPLGETAECNEPDRDDLSLRVQRFDDRLAVVQGLAGRDVRALALSGPAGAGRTPVALRDGAFIGVTPSTGALNERATLVATLAGGRRIVRRLALAPHDVPTRWSTYEVRERGRVLRIRWGSATSPFSGADVRLGRRTARVTVYERFGPSFTDDGFAIFYNQPLILKCADVVLPGRLGGRRVVSGRPRGRVRPLRGRHFGPDRCPRVRAGERLDVRWDATR